MSLSQNSEKILKLIAILYYYIRFTQNDVAKLS